MAKTAKPKKNEFPCIIFKQNGHTLYFFVASAKSMNGVLAVNRRTEEGDQGYQRILSASRVKAISKYIEDKNCVPQSLLVALDKAEIIKKGDIQYISFDQSPNTGWIIDGQHRFTGAVESKVDILMPFVALVGAPVEDQIRLFITINQEAKGVPSSLYLDLLKNFPKRTPVEEAKERAADIGTELKKDDQSPFYAKIVVTTSPKSGEISLTNFVRKVQPLISAKGLLHAFTLVEQKQIISNYYSALKNVFPSEFNKSNSIFFQTLGFGALMNAFPTFFSMCLRDYRGFTVADAVKVFKTIDYIDFGAWKNYGTGSAAELTAGNDLIEDLARMNSNDPDNDSGSIRL